MAAANYTYLCVCVAIRDHLEPPDQARARDHRGGVQRRRRRLAWAPTAPTRHPLRCVGEQQEEHEEEHEDDKDDEDEDEDEKDDEEDEEDEDKDEDKDEDEDEDDDDEDDEEHPRPKPRSFRWWWRVEVGAGALCLTFGGGPQQLVVGQHEGPALVLRNQLAHKLLRPCRRRCGHRHPKAVKPGAKGGHQSLAGWQQRRKERQHSLAGWQQRRKERQQSLAGWRQRRKGGASPKATSDGGSTSAALISAATFGCPRWEAIEAGETPPQCSSVLALDLTATRGD